MKSLWYRAIGITLCFCTGTPSIAVSTGRASRPARPAYDVSYFYVGGSYMSARDSMFGGAMYVERWQPRSILRPYPLVLFHGAGMTGTNWTGTPDGRPGWAQFFVNRGYVVYIVDQPLRGRSGWDPGTSEKFSRFSVNTVERIFTASERYDLWPQAKLHTQWPGGDDKKGLAGDPAFDAFYASTTAYLDDNAETQRLVQAAGTTLLDRIGPAILLTHSQAGAFGWLLADKRPNLVKAIVAIEPLGPPFASNTSDVPARPWGVTDIPITYNPAVADPAEIAREREVVPTAAGLVACARQKQPARKLVNLQRIPILIASGEASYHASYDHCTANFLKQAGAAVDFVRLADVGIRGNGHMMMLEKNSDDIAAFVARWIEHRKPGGSTG